MRHTLYASKLTLDRQALTSIGFAYSPAPAGGSQRYFSRDTADVTVSFNWDEVSPS